MIGGSTKLRAVVVAAIVVGGCADQPAISPRDSLVDPIRAGMVLDLDVTGGPHAGRYHVETLQGSCSRRTYGRGSWVIGYAKQGARPSAMHLTISDAAAAEQGTGGTGEFALGVVLGAESREFGHEIAAVGGRRGSSIATVHAEGAGAVVRVDGRTEDGVRLEATIRCNDVVRVLGMDGG